MGLCTFLDGRQWPSGCPLANRRHWVGRILYPVSAGCFLMISCPTLMHPEPGTSGPCDRRNPWPECCSAVQRGWGANQSPLQCSMGTPEMHGPFNESQWGWYCRSLALGINRQWTQNSPIPEEEATLLGEELEMPEAPEAAASHQECLETLEPKEPTE